MFNTLLSSHILPECNTRRKNKSHHAVQEPTTDSPAQPLQVLNHQHRGNCLEEIMMCHQEVSKPTHVRLQTNYIIYPAIWAAHAYIYIETSRYQSLHEKHFIKPSISTCYQGIFNLHIIITITTITIITAYPYLFLLGLY